MKTVSLRVVSWCLENATGTSKDFVFNIAKTHTLPLSEGPFFPSAHWTSYILNFKCMLRSS